MMLTRQSKDNIYVEDEIYMYNLTSSVLVMDTPLSLGQLAILILCVGTEPTKNLAAKTILVYTQV